MAHENVELERRRLERVYSGMAEGELRALAEDSRSLTPDAVQALKAEIARRKLDIAFSQCGNEAGAESEELVTIQSFRELPEAMLAKGMLDSAGIPCVVVDENIGRMLGSGAVAGIRLQVNRPDAKAAVELLMQPTSESCTCGSKKQVYRVEVYVCPNCGRVEFVMPPDAMQRLQR